LGKSRVGYSTVVVRLATSGGGGFPISPATRRWTSAHRSGIIEASRFVEKRFEGKDTTVFAARISRPMVDRCSFYSRTWVCWILIGTLFGCVKPIVPARLHYLGYAGRVNEHHIAIDAPPERIFSILTDFDRFPGLVPSDRIRVSKVTAGPYGVGTVIRTQTGYQIKVSWTARVVDVQEGRRIVLQFQEGMFRGGYEIWELQEEGERTHVSHTILFNIANVIYRVLWVLKDVESKHDTLVEATLSNLKNASETGNTSPLELSKSPI
jgi:ribosome-associated toxin RatA of RatAB toxin-antitoxin module